MLCTCLPKMLSVLSEFLKRWYTLVLLQQSLVQQPQQQYDTKNSGMFLSQFLHASHRQDE